MFNKVFNFHEIMAFLAGAVNAPEGLIVSWTNGSYNYAGDPWISGLLTRLNGSPVGLLQLVYGSATPQAFAYVRTPNGVRYFRLPYRGAYVWPSEIIADKRLPLERRGRKLPVPQPPAPRSPRRRPHVRRRVARD